MSVVLGTIVVATVIWLLFKLLLVEFPSARVIMAMRKIHGPAGLPFFIGETWNFMKMGTGDILEYLKEQTSMYPRLTGFFLSGVPMIIVQQPQDIKHILGSNRNIKKGIEYGTIMSWLNEGLLTSYGTKWHSRRKMLTPTFHFKILEDALTGMEKNTDILVDKLTKAESKSVVVDDYITRCTLDIIGETAMGVHLNAQTEDKNEYLETVKKAAIIIMMRVLSVYQMNDAIFNLTTNSKKYYNCLKTLHGFTDKVIAERKEASESSDNSDEDALGRKKKKAFLDSLISMQQANPETFTDQDIREEVDTFMFEGHDTTSAALCFGLWLLGTHQDVQEKLYQEIMDTVGDGEMSMASLNSMNYLERVIKETLRLYPSVPYISRRLTEDIVLDDGTILPNTSNVIILPIFLHRDPEQYPDPDRFDPERFTEEESKGRHPYAYIPFSAGPRNCVGQKFAILEMKITIASVIRKCRVEAVTKREDFKILPHLIIRPTEPIKCKFIPRSN